MIPFNICCSTQYQIGEGEICRVKPRKGMQQLTQEGQWEDVKLDEMYTYPEEYQTVIANKDHEPIEEFNKAITDLLDLKNCDLYEPYTDLMIYYRNQPKTFVKTDITDFEEIENYLKIKTTYSKIQEWYIYTVFHAVRVNRKLKKIG